MLECICTYHSTTLSKTLPTNVPDRIEPAQIMSLKMGVFQCTKMSIPQSVGEFTQTAAHSALTWLKISEPTIVPIPNDV